MGFHTTISVAQTFTAGISGTLHHADVEVIRSSTGTTVGGVPNASLASGTVSAASAPLFFPMPRTLVTLDFSGDNIVVNAGETYALVLSSADNYTWIGSTAGGYAGGGYFQRNNPSAGWSESSYDLHFRTFVDTAEVASVPEPTSFVTICIAAASLAASRRVRRRTPIYRPNA